MAQPGRILKRNLLLTFYTLPGKPVEGMGRKWKGVTCTVVYAHLLHCRSLGRMWPFTHPLLCACSCSGDHHCHKRWRSSSCSALRMPHWAPASTLMAPWSDILWGERVTFLKVSAQPSLIDLALRNGSSRLLQRWDHRATNKNLVSWNASKLRYISPLVVLSSWSAQMKYIYLCFQWSMRTVPE